MTLFISTAVLGQNRQLHIETFADGDSSLWYKWQMELCNKIELDTVQKTKYNLYFRLWTSAQAIDIWEDIKGQRLGKITSWTEEFNQIEQKLTNQIFFKQENLDSSQVAKMWTITDSSKIKDIPDENFITEWEQGYDGITYIIETATKKDYFFKTYWTPSAQDSLKEAIIVQDFIDKILTYSNATKFWNNFSVTIPSEYYSNGGIVFNMKKERVKDNH